MDKVGYKRLRTTIALIARSTALLKAQDAELTLAINAVIAANYRFDMLDARTLECILSIDDALAQQAASEFSFVPDLGSIRDHGSSAATCALCGKGDSKGDGSNVDLLRYDFLLRNNSSNGISMWVGKTCILRFGLRVEGAATAAEATRILELAMRTHMRWWLVQAFQAAYPDHGLIPQHLVDLERLAADRPWLTAHANDRETARRVARELPSAVRMMRRAHLFYRRHGRLTPLKLTYWQKAKELIKLYGAREQT